MSEEYTALLRDTVKQLGEAVGVVRDLTLEVGKLRARVARLEETTNMLVRRVGDDR